MNSTPIYATRVKMRSGCSYNPSLLEIDSIYLSGDSITNGFYKKEVIHDWLANNPDLIIRVNISPYPRLIDATSIRGEKFVKSTPNGSADDNLLKLPRA